MTAFCIWLVSLIIERKRLYPQPLALPLLAYIVLSGLSCVFSYEPYMSWPHMKLVCWTALIATLFAQNLERLSQVRTLVLLLLLSATAVGGFTAWQYLRGTGLRVVDVTYRSPLHLAELRPDDILLRIGCRPFCALAGRSCARSQRGCRALIPQCASAFFAAAHPCAAKRRVCPGWRTFSPTAK